MKEEKREYYINSISYYQDILRIVRDKHENWKYLTEYDSVYQDILDYQENEFEDFKKEEDFIEFIKYLKDLIICGLDVECEV